MEGRLPDPTPGVGRLGIAVAVTLTLFSYEASVSNGSVRERPARAGRRHRGLFVDRVRHARDLECPGAEQPQRVDVCEPSVCGLHHRVVFEHADLDDARTPSHLWPRSRDCVYDGCCDCGRVVSVPSVLLPITLRDDDGHVSRVRDCPQGGSPAATVGRAVRCSDTGKEACHGDRPNRSRRGRNGAVATGAPAECSARSWYDPCGRSTCCPVRRHGPVRVVSVDGRVSGSGTPQCLRGAHGASPHGASRRRLGAHGSGFSQCLRTGETSC
ncbi:hypothetical protein BMS3Bbin02_02227 [bacterium BMS3Bbin02]|nr:hypothetical protein BMS3Bbin02_02227 [bacterium BMS3Bbin02]